MNLKQLGLKERAVVVGQTISKAGPGAKFAIPVAIMMLYVAVLSVTLVNLAKGEKEESYAELLPAPDAIVWEVGDETAVWLSTNRHSADVRLSNIGLGIGEIDVRSPTTGQAVGLGKGLGCLEAVVSGLHVRDITDTSATASFTLDHDRNALTKVYWRRYQAEQFGGSAFVNAVEVGGESRTVTVSGLTKGDAYRLDVSADWHFPKAITRSVTFTAGDADSSGSDYREEEVHLVKGAGVTLVACAETQDIIVTLHGEGGRELNRYVVDIQAAGPTPTHSPPETKGHVTRRVCVDAMGGRANYLDGGEKVGPAFTASDFDLSGTASYTLSALGSDIYLFDIDASGQITVSDAGGGDTQGLSGDRVYAVRVLATDDAGAAGYLDVGVWVDVSATSTEQDGICP